MKCKNSIPTLIKRFLFLSRLCFIFLILVNFFFHGSVTLASVEIYGSGREQKQNISVTSTHRFNVFNSVFNNINNSHIGFFSSLDYSADNFIEVFSH